MKTSGISKADVLDRPEMVLEVLNFNDQYQKQQNKGNGHITVTNDDVIGVSKPVPKGVAPPPPKQEAPVAIPESNSAPPEDKQLSLGNFAKCWEKFIFEADLISKEDPNLIYRDPKKVGEGAAGEVFLAVDSRWENYLKWQIHIKKIYTAWKYFFPEWICSKKMFPRKKIFFLMRICSNFFLWIFLPPIFFHLGNIFFYTEFVSILKQQKHIFFQGIFFF